MLKSKTRDQKKFMFIKRIIKNMYEEPPKPPRDSPAPPARPSEPGPQKGALRINPTQETIQHKKGAPEEVAKTGAEDQAQNSMIRSRGNKFQSKAKTKLEEGKKWREKASESNGEKRVEQVPENVILLFDDSSSESAILGKKTNQQFQPGNKEKEDETEKREFKEEQPKLTKINEQAEPKKKEASVAVTEKYFEVLRKLDLKIERTDYFLEKMKKLNSHWDEARYDINKYTGRGNQLVGLFDYLRAHGIRASESPGKEGRLRLNRLNFMIQKITPRPSRNYEQFSLFESYLILKLFVLPQNQAHAQFDTEAVVQILSDYLGREKQSIYSQKENLENNTKFVNSIDLVEHLLFDHLGEDAQDFKFGRESEVVQIFEKEGTGVVRFSFLVDIFLLHFYILYNVTNFVDKMDMVIKIINALTNNSDFEIPQKYKLKTKWIKRVYYRTTKSKRRFIADYDFMIFNEEKYIEMIGHFEEVIESKGWKAGLILTNNTFPQTRPPALSAGLLPSENPVKSVSNDDSIEDFTDSIIRKVMKPKKDRKRLKRQKPRKSQATNIDISHQSSHNYFLSKRELEAETGKKNSAFKRVRHEQVPLETHPKSPASPVDCASPQMRAEDICFLTFGIDHLKKQFNFQEIEVEELSRADKEVLADLVGSEREAQDNLQKNILRMLLKQESSSVKEFLRNASISLRNLRLLDLTHLDSKKVISVSQVFYKIEKVVEFIRNTSFAPNHRAPTN